VPTCVGEIVEPASGLLSVSPFCRCRSAEPSAPEDEPTEGQRDRPEAAVVLSLFDAVEHPVLGLELQNGVAAVVATDESEVEVASALGPPQPPETGSPVDEEEASGSFKVAGTLLLMVESPPEDLWLLGVSSGVSDSSPPSSW